MKAIRINNNFELFGVEFVRDLYLTDNDVKKILNKKPWKYQGFYTRISKVTNLHAKKLEKLIYEVFGNTHYYIQIYNI